MLRKVRIATMDSSTEWSQTPAWKRELGVKQSADDVRTRLRTEFVRLQAMSRRRAHREAVSYRLEKCQLVFRDVQDLG